MVLKELEFLQESHSGKNQPEKLISQEEISRNFDNFLDYNSGESGDKIILVNIS